MDIITAMESKTNVILLWLGRIFFVGGLVFATDSIAAALVINEIDYDQVSTDTAEFIELKNVSGSVVNLNGYTVELFNGATGTVYRTVTLPNVDLAADDYYVICGNSATVLHCDMVAPISTGLIQNGPADAIAIRQGPSIIDAVSYEGDTTGIGYIEGTGVVVKDSSTISFVGLSRYPDGTDSNNNNADFALKCITPGGQNQINASSGCFTLSIQSPPAIVEGTDGTTSLNFVVNLSHPATATVTVNYATTDGTAMANSDYIATSGTLAFAVGETSKTVTVTINGDSIAENNNETFKIILSAPSVNAQLSALAANNEAIGTLIDDDTAGITIKTGDLVLYEPQDTATFSLVLNTQPIDGNSVSIPLTAIGACSVSPSGIVTIAHTEWNIGATITVTASDDAIVNPDGYRPCVIQMGNTTSLDPHYHNLLPDEVIFTIQDDDSAHNQHDLPAGTIAAVLPPTMGLTLKTGGKGTISYQIADISGKPIVPHSSACTQAEGCTYILPTATWIKLLAEPTIDSKFSGFSGNSGQCLNGLIFLIQDTTCTAYFDSVAQPDAPTESAVTQVVNPVPPIVSPTTVLPTDPDSSAISSAPDINQSLMQPTVTIPATDSAIPLPLQLVVTPVSELPLAPSPLTLKQTTINPIMPIPSDLDNHDHSDASCLPRDNRLNWPCNANWATLTDFQIQEQGHLSAAVITGTVINQGWAANLKIHANGSVIGGVLTGYITCENDAGLSDFEFKGAVLTGCILEGIILNTGRLEAKGLIHSVKLKAGTKIKGGRLGGKIEGDANSPAILDWLEIDQGSELSNVIIGKQVSIAPNTKLDDSVQFESSTD